MAAVSQLTLTTLSKELDALAVRLKRLSFERPLRVAAVLLASQTKLAFDQGQTPEGVPWLPLKNPSRRRGGSSAKPLRDTDLLMASMTGKGAFHVEEVTKFRLLFGSNLDRAAWHQRGTRTIPARPFLGITPKTVEKIRLVISDHIKREVALG